MNNKIITTYFSKMAKIPDDYVKIIITRYPPKWLDIKNTPRCFLAKCFSPSSDILMKYKKDLDWDDYVERFNHQIKYSAEYKRVSQLLVNNINTKGSKYALICFEKDPSRCHRTLVAENIKSRFGIEYNEFIE